MSEPGVTSATFMCHACGELAAVVELMAKGVDSADANRLTLPDSSDAAGMVRITDFYVSDTTEQVINLEVGVDTFDALEKALAECDPHALHSVYPHENQLIASFYCVDCEEPYCRKCWELKEVLEDGDNYWLGVCPEGDDTCIEL